MVVGLFGGAANVGFVAPEGMVERAEQMSPGSARYKVAGAAADAVQATAGATGTRVATVTSSTTGIGQLIALRPAP
jgi:hypothetical protein